MNSLKRVLLVEDDIKDVELTLAALQENKLVNEVVVTRDGAEALDYLYRRGSYAMRTDGMPAVVLLDLKMPKVDGLQVLRQLKSDDRMRLLPEECYKLGVNAYVVKPVIFGEFVEAVKDLGVFWAIINEPPPIASQ